MDNISNTIQNKALTALSAKAPDNVIGAIKKACAGTGVNFAYMVQQAAAESGFRPDIKAKTSSASGLYQFIESTWMKMVDRYGDKYGIDTEGKSKAEILALRNDPETASCMAAEFAKENQDFLKDNWGGDIGSTELYLAHFMGSGKAAAFLNARDEDPSQAAAIMFPREAKANRAVFYDTATGRAKSLEEVYGFFAKKFTIKGGAHPAEIAGSTDRTAPSAPALNNNSIFLQASGNMHMAKMHAISALGSLGDYSSLVRNPVELMLLSQLETPLDQKKDEMSF